MNVRGAARYRSLDNLTSVGGRSSGELIVLVYDRIGEKLKVALASLRQDRPLDADQALRQACDLLSHGLLGALDYQRGGEIATKLGQLYDYAIRRLLQARLHHDPAIVDEVAVLLEGLREAWATVIGGGAPAIPRPEDRETVQSSPPGSGARPDS